ncbi:MAG: HlyC/CorC family transporter [Oscillospiraceae bacterium]|nr:HlyC/CorC family transporter [Oscillospiraceae bacterium]
MTIITGVLYVYIVRRSAQMERVSPEMWEGHPVAGTPLTWFALGMLRSNCNAVTVLCTLVNMALSVIKVPLGGRISGAMIECGLMLLAMVIIFMSADGNSRSDAEANEAYRLVSGDRLFLGICSVSDSLSSRLYSICTDPAVGEEDVMKLVDEGSEDGGIEKSERDMIDHVFRFHDMPAENVMTHRTDVEAVSVDTPISDVVYKAIDTGFSRLPVYRDNIDHIEGVVCVKDLLCLVGMPSSDATAETFMRDVEYIPRSCVCDDVFRLFTRNKVQMAVVVDEYGGTYGVVTMEDLVELVFGSIRDEYDDEDEEISQISDNVWMISGSAGAAQTMEYLGQPLPDDTEYDTMAGYVTDLIGHVPEDGERPSVKAGNITFTVLVIEDMRIERIKAVKSVDDENTN